MGIVEDGRALVDEARRLKPDVVVADITMPRLNGLDALALLRKDNPAVRVVVITMHRERPTRGVRSRPAHRASC